MGLSQYLANISQPLGLSLVKLSRNEPAQVSPEIIVSLKKQISMDKTMSGLAPAVVSDDAFFHLQVSVRETARLLTQMGDAQAAEEVLSTLCGPVKGSRCGDAVLNALGLSLLHSERYDEAVALFEQLRERKGVHQAVFEANLALAKSKLDSTP